MLALRTTEQDITAWYNPTSAASSTDIAASAYTNAVQFFEQTLTRDGHKRDWIRNQTSMKDVYQVVNQAKALYEDGSEQTSKPRKWINAFASSVTYYGGVLDVLVQYDPAHAALAWGALKFVFTGVLNHAQLVSELSKALTKVGEVLPRAQIDATLYDTPWMRDAISRLYAYIMLFLQKAVKWYTMGSRRRALSSILNPYSSSFKEVVDEIKNSAKTVDSIARTSGRAEIRGLTRGLEGQAETLRLSDRKLYEMQARINLLQASSERTEALITQVLQISMNNQHLASTLQSIDGDSRARISDLQFSQVLDELKSAHLPEETLQICQSFAKRRPSWRQPGRDTVTLVQQLNQWTSIGGSAVLVIRVGPRAETRTKDLVVEVTTFLKSTMFPVFFYLSSPTSPHCETTLATILRDLVFQALRNDPSIVSRHSHIWNLGALGAEHTVVEWISLFGIVFSKISKCFIVVESEDFFRTSGRNSHQMQQLIDTLEHLMNSVASNGGIIKVLFVSYGGQCTLTSIGTQVMASVGPPLPASRRLKHRSAPPLRALMGRRGVQPRLRASGK